MPKKTTATRYLRILGRLYPDNRFVLRPTYLTEKGMKAENLDKSPIQAELSDADNTVLLRTGLVIERYVTDKGVLPEKRIRGRIPFHPKTSTVRLFYKGVQIHEINVPASKPRVSLDWKPAKRNAGKKKISWKGIVPKDSQVRYALRYSSDNGATWQPVGRWTETPSTNIDFKTLPGGDTCRLMVVASDGIHTEQTMSAPFTVPAKPCQAMILYPEPDAVIKSGRAIFLEGQGYYLEEKKAETKNLTWQSSKDGQLGTGGLVQTTLSRGEHTITLRAGIKRRRGTATVTIKVK